MAGKVFMRLDTAAFKCGIVRWEVGFAPRTMTIGIMAISSAVHTAGGQKRACRGNHSVGEPVREVCTDQRCGNCSPGVSDTLGVQVRPVGVYVGNVVLLRL
jgi:hypothetical protein